MHDKIIIKGARQHNLKNISVDIPKKKLVVLTGLSGSGNHICRRPETLCGIAICLCKAIFGIDGQA
jgi:ABC-type proline/glycine betaine transport system ATPase subunit